MFARTPRLLLRPGFPEDAPALTQAIGDEIIVRNLATAPWPYGVRDAEALVRAKAMCLALALADQLVAGRDGYQVGEALERDRVPVLDEVGHCVGERGDLFEFGGDEEDGAAPLAHLDELALDVVGRWRAGDRRAQ